MILRITIIILFCCSLFFFISCSSSNYQVITAKEYKKQKNEKLIYKPYMIFLTDIDGTTASKDEIVKIFSLIENNRFVDAKYFLQQNKFESQEVHDFCYGVYYFYKKKYEEAKSSFEKTDLAGYKYLKHLFIGNCMVELGYPLQEINKHYQMAYDSTISADIKEVIKIHIRYARFGVIK